MSRKSPHSQGALFAVALRRRGEVFRDTREKEARISPTGRFGDRASLKHDRLCARACEVVRGRDPGDSCADDRDVGGGIAVEAREDVGRDLVEPDARHLGYCAAGADRGVRWG